MPRELVEGERTRYQALLERNKPSQTIEEIMPIVQEARRLAPIPQTPEKEPMLSMDADDSDSDVDTVDVETSDDFLDLNFYDA